ncbi:hypothetical protein HYR82_05410 [Candidatus Peregrinibacteria bacterium]|nr:hypothetical protein [Candidatus Peregrinibacteria bacterium]
MLVPVFAFAASDSMMMEHSSMSEGDMMMQADKGMMNSSHMTEGLSRSCHDLKMLSTDEKTKMLTDIGHNMDAGALKQVLRCMFPGSMKKRIARITDRDLKFDPKRAETLYYVPSTHQFFVTCTGMKTVAYVVQGDETIVNPRSYFNDHRQQFVDAAKMGKEMFEKMMMEMK